jgi:hypothetical protein
MTKIHHSHITFACLFEPHPPPGSAKAGKCRNRTRPACEECSYDRLSPSQSLGGLLPEDCAGALCHQQVHQSHVDCPGDPLSDPGFGSGSGSCCDV